MVKYCIAHHRMVLPPRQNIEATAVELSKVLGGVLLVSAYKPPTAPVLDADLSCSFRGAYVKVILADDLNCKHPDWGSCLATTSERALRRYLHDHHLRAYEPGLPMHYLRRLGARPDILDIAVVKRVAIQIEVSVLTELSSDHCPIEVHVPT